MTPEEKATEIILKMYEELDSCTEFKKAVAKKCALVAVNGTLSFLNEYDLQENGKIRGIYDQDYWEQVKSEINLR